MYRIDQFTHDKEANTLTAEASSLGIQPGQWPRSLRIDAGNGRVFILAQSGVLEKEVGPNGEMEVLEVIYTHPILPHLPTVRIFND